MMKNMRAWLVTVGTVLLLPSCTRQGEVAPRPAKERVSQRQAALGVPQGGFPSWGEQVIYVLTNRARAEPGAEQSGSTLQPVPPLAWDANQGKAARFQAVSLAKSGSGLSHDSVCKIVADIADLYPDQCDGSPECACEGGQAALDCSCDDRSSDVSRKQYCFCGGGLCPAAYSRVGLFRASFTGENAAAGSSDPQRAFSQWVASPGHWSNLTSSNHSSIGTGLYGGGEGCWGAYAVQVFGRAGSAPTFGGGVHYPQSVGSGGALTFYINYYDPAGAATLATVNIDGLCHPLGLERGSASHGNQSLETSLADGCHRYYFVFRDAGGALLSYPSEGSYGVAVGGGGCPFYDASRPALGDGCGSCNDATECDDNNPCTTDRCDQNRCASLPVNGCCLRDTECDDNNLCTTDRCDQNRCSSAPNGSCKRDSGRADMPTGDSGTVLRRDTAVVVTPDRGSGRDTRSVQRDTGSVDLRPWNGGPQDGSVDSASVSTPDSTSRSAAGNRLLRGGCALDERGPGTPAPALLLLLALAACRRRCSR